MHVSGGLFLSVSGGVGVIVLAVVVSVLLLAPSVGTPADDGTTDYDMYLRTTSLVQLCTCIVFYE